MSDEPESRDLVAHFEAAYESTPPWDIGAPQPAFAKLAADGRLRGRVLDVGCGTGEHVLLAAEVGCDAVGVDIVPSAIHLAEAKARERLRPARFIVGDALQLGLLGEHFDIVMDCGLFHVFDDADRPRFVDSLAQVVRRGGRYFMLCFSDQQPGVAGPRRVSQDEIRAAFADGWHVDSITTSVIETNWQDRSASAWLATITRN